MMKLRAKRKEKKSQDGAMLVSIMQEVVLVDEASENYQFVTGLQDPCLHCETINGDPDLNPNHHGKKHWKAF